MKRQILAKAIIYGRDKLANEYKFIVDPSNLVVK